MLIYVNNIEKKFRNKLLIYANLMIIYVNNIQKKYFKKYLIYVNFMLIFLLIYFNITERQTDKNIKSIVLNLTK